MNQSVNNITLRCFLNVIVADMLLHYYFFGLLDIFLAIKFEMTNEGKGI